jgi:hypothetical protein
LGAVRNTLLAPFWSVVVVPWLTPSMNTVPFSLGASLSNKKKNVLAPLFRVAGAQMAAG